MLRFLPDSPPGQPLRVLCLGAHCDDVEIGAGGTLLALAQERPIEVEWVILTSDAVRAREARSSARWFLSQGQVLPASLERIHIHEFRPSFLPSHFEELKELFYGIRQRMDPHLVFSHHRGDRHQDHHMVAELTWNTFRNHAILEYEIAKFEGDLGQPNAFVELPRPLVDAKIDAIRTHYASQADKTWFDEEAFRGLMRLRGIECNATSRYAEAFHLSKILL
ncbi:MAG: PIG-L family deacetylase [Planctomycetes bacterium]|nr:PIG-L family deacetylase [Planctomycetota bacterium]MCB9911092.1 PIG-L family deacetylase [Planctomycetota bacterium]HRV82745.1 PIG-L family deacetylase [Planctomycetota bacterium]